MALDTRVESQGSETHQMDKSREAISVTMTRWARQDPETSTETLPGPMGEFGGFTGDGSAERNSSHFCVLTPNGRKPSRNTIDGRFKTTTFLGATATKNVPGDILKDLRDWGAWPRRGTAGPGVANAPVLPKRLRRLSATAGKCRGEGFW